MVRVSILGFRPSALIKKLLKLQNQLYCVHEFGSEVRNCLCHMVGQGNYFKPHCQLGPLLSIPTIANL